MASINVNDIVDSVGNVDPNFQMLFGEQQFESVEDAKARGLIIDGDNTYIYRDYKGRNIPMLCKIEVGPAIGCLVKPFGAWVNSRWDNVLFDCAANMGIWIDVNDEQSEWNWKDLVVDCLEAIDPKTGKLDYKAAAASLVKSFFNINAQICYPDGLVNGIYAFLHEWYKDLNTNVVFRDKLYQSGSYATYEPGDTAIGFSQLILDELNNHFPGITPNLGPASDPTTPFVSDFFTALQCIIPNYMRNDTHLKNNILNSGTYNIVFKGRVLVIRDEYARKQYKLDYTANQEFTFYKQNASLPINVSVTQDAEGNTINRIEYPSQGYIKLAPEFVLGDVTKGCTYGRANYVNRNDTIVSVGGFQILSSQEDTYYDVQITMMNYEGILKPFTPTVQLTGKGLNIDRPGWGPEYPTPHRDPEDDPVPPIDDYVPEPEPDPYDHEVPEPVPPPPPPIPDPDPDPPIDVDPPTEENEDAFIHIYHPAKADLDAINTEMWSADAITEFKKWWSNNPIDGIVSLHKVFIPVTNKTSKPVVMGTYTFNTSCYTLDRYQTCDLGRVEIPRYFNNYRDFDATISIYLPGIGFRDLDINDVTAIHGTTSIHIVYKVDIFTGDFIAYLEINKGNVTGRNGVCQYMFDGNMKCEYPLSGASRSGLVSGIIGTVGNVLGGAVGGAVTGGPAGAAVGAGKGLISSAGDIAGAVKQSIQKSGSLGGTLSALSIKYPFAIISRPIPYDNEYHDQITGRATNQCVLVRSMSGLTSFKDIHVDIPRASDTENYKILQYLKEGIIV